ncbi:DUF4919 domain-containing protein [Coprobacter tertius]|uniref:DUF4919 domain-containing protein n=1 Tax=Coprobacter tertius TaxID=2944915 RepID=A0ABT1MK21_9BACT|nr:DUF4919 domain-containing protein [Coprobacter tertius]MCP9612972.1 DUF4919 domain-containing protein [Coprobacter tertius]
MKHLYLLVILFIVSFGIKAQTTTKPEPPDMKRIETEIRDYNSEFYYPRLMKRYLKNDTTLTLNEFRHLYYGYSFQEGYNPYRISPHTQALANDMYSHKEHSISDCDSIAKYAILALDDFPFDLRQMNFLIYALNHKNMESLAAVWKYKLRNTINAILSTGDGNSPETAWWVIYPTHEYDIVNHLGYTGSDYNFVEPTYDYLELEKNPLKTKGFYFNVSRILEEYNRKYKE